MSTGFGHTSGAHAGAPHPPTDRGTTRGTAPTHPPPPGSRAAEHLLALLGAPALAALLIAPTRWDLEVLRSDPVLGPVALLCATGAVLLGWNLLFLVAAFLATSRHLPRRAARALSGLVETLGSSHSRSLLARRSAAAALGTGLVLSVGSGAMASAPRAWAHPLTASPSVSSAEAPGDGPPEDLGWGAATGTADASVPSPPATATTTALTTSPSREGSSRGSRHVVSVGESLWSIAAEHLGPDAGPDRVASLWPRIHAANIAVIGDDPDLIHPGAELVIPGGA